MITINDKYDYVKNQVASYSTFWIFADNPPRTDGTMTYSTQTTCRESVGSYVAKYIGNKNYPAYYDVIGYSSPLLANGHGGAIAFWRNIEKMLGIPESRIEETNYNKLLVIFPDPFWKTSHLHVGMFTLLLRLAFTYGANESSPDKPVDIATAIDRYSLAASIRQHVIDFLHGAHSAIYEGDNPPFAYHTMVSWLGGGGKIVKLYRNSNYKAETTCQ